MAGNFVIKKGATGEFRFNLLARNGQVVATSEAYGSKAAAMGGIRSEGQGGKEVLDQEEHLRPY